MKNHSVLFVCLGNICRSPMAEYVLRHRAREAGVSHRVRTDSAGTSGSVSYTHLTLPTTPYV